MDADLLKSGTHAVRAKLRTFHHQLSYLMDFPDTRFARVLLRRIIESRMAEPGPALEVGRLASPSPVPARPRCKSGKDGAMQASPPLPTATPTPMVRSSFPVFLSESQHLPLDNALRPWYTLYHQVHNNSTYLEYTDLPAGKGAQDAFFPFCEDAERET